MTKIFNLPKRKKLFCPWPVFQNYPWNFNHKNGILWTALKRRAINIYKYQRRVVGGGAIVAKPPPPANSEIYGLYGVFKAGAKPPPGKKEMVSPPPGQIPDYASMSYCK